MSNIKEVNKVVYKVLLDKNGEHIGSCSVVRN